MATRNIITINEDLCTGCGNCITGCAEGALQLVDGKAKLVKETFCDGFGDCIGTCPTGALKIVEKEAEVFDFDKTIEHVEKTRGEDGVNSMREAHKKHEEKLAPAAPRQGGGCPGTRMRMTQPAQAQPAKAVAEGAMPVVMKSEISQWPVQLHLLQPKAPFFDNRELVILSTCSPVTSPDVQWRFIRGRSVAIACPKLDRTEGYVEKLAEIFTSNNIPRVIVLRMEVPCCGGLTAMVSAALERGKPQNMVVDEVVMNLEGEVIRTNRLY
ncbi:MAG: 4Fe-4S dicluster domain-containing protein [Candidatus Riflebacteria bacterium]|nr:4Fe-4S dicluster domain-containing protein [Candidatus Riflebacteria bacterium]